MGATRQLTVVITNERFGEDIVEETPVPVLPNELTTRLAAYVSENELTFYSEVLLDAASERLCRMQGITLDEYDPAQFMADEAIYTVRVPSAYNISLTYANGDKLQVHDDMEITACNVAELAAAYAPLCEQHPMCDIKLRQESPVLHQLLQDVRRIDESSDNGDRIVLFIWE